MLKLCYVQNYIEAYEKHFKNPNRNNATFENLQYASFLLDKYCKGLTFRTFYKGCYEDCKKLLQRNI